VAQAQSDSAKRIIPTGAVIDGIVTDTSLHPLADATVQIPEANVHVRHRGERPVSRLRCAVGLNTRSSCAAWDMNPQPWGCIWCAPDTSRVSVILEPAVTTIKAVKVTAASSSPKLAEFETRRLAGEGQFVTREPDRTAQHDRRGGPAGRHSWPERHSDSGCSRRETW